MKVNYYGVKRILIKVVKELLQENNTLFNEMVKNVENNHEFKDYIFDLIINSNYLSF
ncbi:MAG: hypothetical protein A370_03075 [Clostridium sp. Maddingley MBC34-26]|uniref:hypothetical protein n=1 Tax=Clostridium sp. LS TaxID=1352601 RepID=UPI000297421D|nr:hypothetical protein [Clostridium sp. LS]EKQ54724.1 MAG: hypothetical protein A370_03075 [Clostridium sp. Maddingley MBC34-26]